MLKYTIIPLLAALTFSTATAQIDIDLAYKAASPSIALPNQDEILDSIISSMGDNSLNEKECAQLFKNLNEGHIPSYRYVFKNYSSFKIRPENETYFTVGGFLCSMDVHKVDLVRTSQTSNPLLEDGEAQYHAAVLRNTWSERGGSGENAVLGFENDTKVMLERSADLGFESASTLLGILYLDRFKHFTEICGGPCYPINSAEELEGLRKKSFEYFVKAAETITDPKFIGTTKAEEYLLSEFDFDFQAEKVNFAKTPDHHLAAPPTNGTLAVANSTYSDPTPKAVPFEKFEDLKPSPSNLIFETVFVNVNTLNTRSGPSSSSYKRRSLSFGDQVNVYGYENDWLKVSGPSENGEWVHSDYVTKTRPPKRTFSKPKTVSKVQKDDCGFNNKFSSEYWRIHRKVQCNAISDIGRDGLSSYDVETLWMGAEKILRLRQCGQVQDASKSIYKSNTYWINCTNISENIFFIRRGDIIGMR